MMMQISHFLMCDTLRRTFHKLLDTLWYIDSNATRNMTFNKDWYISYQSIPPQIILMGDNGFQKQ